MGVRKLEHFLILSEDPLATRDWWCNVIGLREGDHPQFAFPVHWLYVGEQDVLHIAGKRHSAVQDTYMSAPGDESVASAEGARDASAIDHICFQCEGLAEFIERLEANGVDFNERQAEDQASYQLFVREPINGIKVELGFAAEEARAAGRVT